MVCLYVGGLGSNATLGHQLFKGDCSSGDSGHHERGSCRGDKQCRHQFHESGWGGSNGIQWDGRGRVQCSANHQVVSVSKETETTNKRRNNNEENDRIGIDGAGACVQRVLTG